MRRALPRCFHEAAASESGQSSGEPTSDAPRIARASERGELDVGHRQGACRSGLKGGKLATSGASSGVSSFANAKGSGEKRPLDARPLKRRRRARRDGRPRGSGYCALHPDASGVADVDAQPQ